MNCIIQGTRDIAPAHLNHLAGLTTASRIEQTATHTYRLYDAKPHDAVAVYCYENQLDYGFVRPSQHLSDFGLVVMDMDSTLISIECIDEIADMVHVKPQVAAITEAAMRGKIDFSESLRRRVALLAKELGIKTMLVSGGFVFFADRLKQRLDLDYAHANTLEIINGKLTGNVLGPILDAQGKADWLVHIRDELKLKAEQVIALGDGANDLKMMAQAGVSIAYHAKPVVLAQASYAFNFVGLDGLVNLFHD